MKYACVPCGMSVHIKESQAVENSLEPSAMLSFVGHLWVWDIEPHIII